MKKIYLLSLILLAGIGVSRAQSGTEWQLVKSESGVEISYSKQSLCHPSGTILIKITNHSASDMEIAWSLPEDAKPTPLTSAVPNNITISAGSAKEGACSSTAPVQLTWFIVNSEWVPTSAIFQIQPIQK